MTNNVLNAHFSFINIYSSKEVLTHRGGVVNGSIWREREPVGGLEESWCLDQVEAQCLGGASLKLAICKKVSVFTGNKNVISETEMH